MRNAIRTLRTISHLKPVQFTNRLTRRLPKRIDLSPADLPQRARRGSWRRCPGRAASMTGPGRLLLLAEEGDLSEGAGWNDPGRSKLWLYHLHYFDDLLAEGAGGRAAWHRGLVAGWLAENPPMKGVGWEPYPLSRRIGNWIPWALEGGDLGTDALRSLVLQARVLARSLEWHLLGNHLFANARALVFAGCFFEGAEADHWLRTGLAILDRELPEQILPDGGHFELSPMYHVLTLEDMIDLCQLSAIYPDLLGGHALRQRWTARTEAMIGWLAAMRHPDGEISFFNDSTFGQARAPADVLAYAGLFGLGTPAPAAPGPMHLAPSGYIRLRKGDWTAFFDVGPVGPAYIPGHAHADTLSLEISLGGERVVTNSGTSTYAVGPRRDWERSTAAHATVEVDGTDSSEMWASFRVGRRARPLDVASGAGPDLDWAAGSHDGYRHLPGRPIHRRRVEVGERRLVVTDEIDSRTPHAATGRLPLHPSVSVVDRSGEGFTLRTAQGRTLRVAVAGADAVAEGRGTFASGFGRVEDRPVLEWRCRTTAGRKVTTEIAL